MASGENGGGGGGEDESTRPERARRGSKSAPPFRRAAGERQDLMRATQRRERATGNNKEGNFRSPNHGANWPGNQQKAADPKGTMSPADEHGVAELQIDRLTRGGTRESGEEDSPREMNNHLQQHHHHNASDHDDDQQPQNNELHREGLGGAYNRPQKYCAVCGDKAIACNFNAVTCESCKAFFRRNAFKEQRLRCLFENRCVIDRVTRRFCSKCRLLKCLQIGMKREWILTDEQKQIKRAKIMQNKRAREVGQPVDAPAVPAEAQQLLQENNCTTANDELSRTDKLLVYESTTQQTSLRLPKKRQFVVEFDGGEPAKRLQVAVEKRDAATNCPDEQDLIRGTGPNFCSLAHQCQFCNLRVSQTAPMGTTTATLQNQTQQVAATFAAQPNFAHQPLPGQHYLQHNSSPSHTSISHHQPVPQDASYLQQVTTTCRPGSGSSSSVVARHPIAQATPNDCPQVIAAHDEASVYSAPPPPPPPVCTSGQATTTCCPVSGGVPQQVGPATCQVSLANFTQQATSSSVQHITNLQPTAAAAATTKSLHEMQTVCQDRNNNGLAGTCQAYLAAPPPEVRPSSAVVAPKPDASGVERGEEEAEEETEDEEEEEEEEEEESEEEAESEQDDEGDLNQLLKAKSDNKQAGPEATPTAQDEGEAGGLEPSAGELGLVIWRGETFCAPAVNEQEIKARVQRLDFNESERRLVQEMLEATHLVFDSSERMSNETVLEDIVFFCDAALRRLIKTVKQIGAFRVLCMDDQIVLLKNACFKILLLRSSLHFQDDVEGWRDPRTGRLMLLKSLKNLKCDNYERHKAIMDKLAVPLRNDRLIMAFMIMIILFDPTADLKHSNSVGLDHMMYLSSLRKYLIGTQPDPLAKYERIVETFETINACNEEYNLFFSINYQPEQITPLLIEIFDISINDPIA